MNTIEAATSPPRRVIRGTDVTLRVLRRVELHLFWPLVGIAMFFAIWQALAIDLGPFRLPTPASLWPEVYKDLTANRVLAFQGGGTSGLYPHLLYTIQQTLEGSAIGVTCGVTLGLMMGRFVVFQRLVQVPVEVLRTIPPLAAMPFLLIWFGPTRVAQLGLVAFYTGVMLTVTTLNAVSNLNPLYSQFALTLGATKNRVYRNVVLPAIVPQITGGIRVAVGIAWGFEVTSELLGAPKGMGQVLNKMVSFQAVNVILVTIFWITVAATFFDLLIVRVIRLITRWTPASR